MTINPSYDIINLREQVFLGGRLGDGNFKKNGLYNYTYRESHAEDELGYLKWKMNVLDNMISNQGLHQIKKKGWNIQQGYEICTKTTSSLIKYATMPIEDVVLNLDYRGLIIFLFDDGWNSNGHFMISSGSLSEPQLDLIINQFDKYGIDDVKLTGIKRKDISIPRKHTQTIYNMATSFIPKDTDIIIKKFKLKENEVITIC